jgi:hypothetical protein
MLLFYCGPWAIPLPVSLKVVMNLGLALKNIPFRNTSLHQYMPAGGFHCSRSIRFKQALTAFMRISAASISAWVLWVMPNFLRLEMQTAPIGAVLLCTTTIKD